MKRNRPLLALLVPLLAGSCSLDTTPDGETTGPDESRVSAVAHAERILLTNRTARPVLYAVFERDFATRGLFLWTACADPEACPAIEPGETVAVPYRDITGYYDGAAEALVYWWHPVRRPDGGFEVDRIRSFIARL